MWTFYKLAALTLAVYEIWVSHSFLSTAIFCEGTLLDLIQTSDFQAADRPERKRNLCISMKTLAQRLYVHMIIKVGVFKRLYFFPSRLFLKSVRRLSRMTSPRHHNLQAAPPMPLPTRHRAVSSHTICGASEWECEAGATGGQAETCEVESR